MIRGVCCFRKLVKSAEAGASCEDSDGRLEGAQSSIRRCFENLEIGVYPDELLNATRIIPEDEDCLINIVVAMLRTWLSGALVNCTINKLGGGRECPSICGRL